MENVLRKAFMNAMYNPALTFADYNTDFIVIKSAMIGYLERKDCEYSEDEVENYIKKKFAEIHEFLKDFSYSNKMMD